MKELRRLGLQWAFCNNIKTRNFVAPPCIMNMSLNDKTLHLSKTYIKSVNIICPPIFLYKYELKKKEMFFLVLKTCFNLLSMVDNYGLVSSIFLTPHSGISLDRTC